ncbi:hypothetical protein FHU36_002031 [Nonomuraea muscovyensis]|uniref:Uncharacterized protein n=1 Tax=Nonomuraea muscovyensis TaxID=1124761 RepID=A0A7X0BYZ7_9ACTN|nr:hypothetical protein [Nonomuraea muscovyensis]MBB6345522.1 hypothetical protein [Nonomuraea muscovyensis]
MWTEMLKAVPNLVVALITLSLGWLVGLRLTARWDERKKRRELDLLALGAFYEAYGQFCAIWKSWDGAPDSLRQDDPFQTEMLRRAAEAEGKVESLLVRLASERSLSQQECTLLSCFRQAFQSLRKSIRRKVPLQSRIYAPGTLEVVAHQWASSEDPPYLAFKALAGYTSDLMSRSSRSSSAPMSSFISLRQITSNALERMWVDETFQLLDLGRRS